MNLLIPIASFLILTFSFISCNDKNQLEGSYKIKSFSFYDQVNKREISFKLEDPQSVQKAISTASFINFNKKQIDSLVSVYRENYFILKSDSSFSMNDHGLIIPNSMPGYHFDKLISGKWSFDIKRNIILLSTLDEFIIKYKVLKTDKNNLLIGQVVDETEKSFSEILLERQ